MGFSAHLLEPWKKAQDHPGKVANQTKNLTGFQHGSAGGHAWPMLEHMLWRGTLRRWQNDFFRNRVKKGSALYLIHEDVTYEVAFVTRCPMRVQTLTCALLRTKMEPMNMNAHTYVYGTDVETHRELQASYIDVASCGSKCRVWSVKCRVWSVKRSSVPPLECRV